MKKEWIMPQASVDQFSTNEYLSTCWEVACNTVAANSYEVNNRNKIASHSPEHCGQASHQVLQDTDGDGLIDKMTEVGTDGLGKLNCTVYTDGTYKTKMNLEHVRPGQYIYWTTEIKGGKFPWSDPGTVWHHQGASQLISATNPNRS